MRLPIWLRAVGAVVLAGGVVTALVSFAALGALLHASLPAGRAVTADFLTSFLSDYFQGSVSVGQVTRLSLRGLSATSVTVHDVRGNRVLVLSQLRARANIEDIVLKLLSDEQKVSLVIHHVRLEHGEAQVIIDPETGLPTLQQALTPALEADETPSERHIRVWLPVIEVGSAFGRGKVALDTPTLEADVANIRGSVLVTPKGTAVDVARFAVELRGLAGADAKGVGTFHLRHPGSTWGFFDGYFGQIQSSAFVRWDEDRLEVRLDVPRADPDEVRAIWADYPLHEQLALHAEAVGPLSNLETKIVVDIDDTNITAQGPLSLVDDSGIELRATGKNVDVGAFFPSVPATSVDLEAWFSLWSVEGQIHLEFNGRTEPGSIASHELPAFDIRGTYDALGLLSRATVHEPGLPAKVSFDVHPDGAIDLTLDAKRFRLDHPRLTPYFQALGTAEGQLTARIDQGALKGDFSADLRAFETASVQLQQARAEGKFEGHIDRLDELNIQARLVGEELRRGGLNFADVVLSAKGPVARPKLEATLSNPNGQRLVAGGNLTTKGRIGLDDLELAVEHQGAKFTVNAASISSSDGQLKIDKLSLKEGDAELTSDIEVLADGIKVRARGRELNLEVMSKALGFRPGLVQGSVTLDVDVVSTRAVQKGVVDVQFEDLTLGLPELEKLSGQAHLALDAGRLTGQGEMQIEGLGTLGAAVDLNLDGRLDDEKAWRRMTGSSRFELYAVNLNYLTRFLDEAWGIEDVAGIGSARVRLERDVPTGPPHMLVDAQTHGLKLTLAADGDAPSKVIEGIDLQAGGSLDGQSGQTSGSVRAVDGQGPLLSASGTARLDVAKLWDEPEALGDVLGDTSLEMVFVVPRRKLEELPMLIRPFEVEGVLSGRLSLSGTAKAPVLSGLLDVEQLRGLNTALSAPVALHTRFNYTKQTGIFGGTLEAERRNKRILWGMFSGNVQLADLLRAPSDEPRFTGDASLSVEAFPLDLLQPLSRARVEGQLDGVIALSKRGHVPDFNARFQVRHGRVQGIALGNGKLSARGVGDKLFAEARFADADGALEVKVNTKLDHTKSDSALGEEPIFLNFESKNYDAVLLLPFVDELFSELSGPLDAELSAVVRKRTAQEQAEATQTSAWDARFVGLARLKQGVIKPAAIGLELRDTNLTLRATREAEHNVVEIVELSGKAASEKLNLRGRGKLYFSGTELAHGWAGAGLDDVPFVVRGVRLADLTGQVSASFRQDPTQMSSRVEIPQLRVLLPRSTGRSLIDLTPNLSIAVLQPLSEATESSEPGLPWHVLVNLGDEVRVQSAALNVRLSGQPELILAEELEVDGKLLLPAGGRVTVAGKLFVIEHGFIQFDTGDHTDPHINIRAVWRAPGGVSITANLVGTAREPELTLESDPPLPGGEAEIFALLFGGGVGDTDSNAASPALGAGATFVSEILGNTALRGVELRAGVEKRGSSGQSSQLAEDEWRSYAAAVPLSDDVWFEGSYKTEQRATAADGRSGFSGTLDWRFKQDWALRTELGELGTAVDLLWQYRY